MEVVMGMEPDESNLDEAFMRKIVFPEEELRSLTSVSWNGGFRWFRSANVVPIERARQRKSKVVEFDPA
jgi:hypothetical protein